MLGWQEESQLTSRENEKNFLLLNLPYPSIHPLFTLTPNGLPFYTRHGEDWALRSKGKCNRLNPRGTLQLGEQALEALGVPTLARRAVCPTKVSFTHKTPVNCFSK